MTEASKLFNNYSPESGVYDISNVCGQPFALYAQMQARCDMKNNDSGWLVLVRRTPDVDERVYFDRKWDEYEKGFGDLNTEFWYGLKNMHCLTNREPVEVQINLKKRHGTSTTLKYGHFVVDGPDNQYTLHVSDPKQSGFDFLGYHNGMKFSTRDKDNDKDSRHCAEVYHGGWWFNACYRMDLTESHTVGPRLYNAGFIPYDYAEMSIRPKRCNE